LASHDIGLTLVEADLQEILIVGRLRDYLRARQRVTVPVMSGDEIVVHQPTGQGPLPEPFAYASRRSLDGDARLVLIENGKMNAREVLELVAEGIKAIIPITHVEVVSKPSSRPLDPAIARAVAERADLVLAGVGDCGSCSSSSLHDAVTMERHGVPSAVIITEPFQGLVTQFATTYGAAGYPLTVIPHPIARADETKLRVAANAVVESVARQLTESLEVEASTG
jgi:hypothetical protein